MKQKNKKKKITDMAKSIGMKTPKGKGKKGRK
jgi:hypothetical protein